MTHGTYDRKTSNNLNMMKSYRKMHLNHINVEVKRTNIQPCRSLKEYKYFYKILKFQPF